MLNKTLIDSIGQEVMICQVKYRYDSQTTCRIQLKSLRFGNSHDITGTTYCSMRMPIILILATHFGIFQAC